MRSELVKRTIRLAVLAAALIVAAHILIDDGRSDWLALIPGAVIASAVYHFGATYRAATRTRATV